MALHIRRVLVTGGAGFIGSAFVRQRLKSDQEIAITVLDKLTYAGSEENLAELRDDRRLRFVKGDICDPSTVDELAKDVDAIVNFAAESHVDRSLLDPGAFVQTDVYGTYVLLEAARKHRHQRFLQVSTDEVYGYVKDGRSKESDGLAPRSPYSATKAGGEMLVQAYHASFGLPTLITRGANTYGPYHCPSTEMDRPSATTCTWTTTSAASPGSSGRVNLVAPTTSPPARKSAASRSRIRS